MNMKEYLEKFKIQINDKVYNIEDKITYINKVYDNNLIIKSKDKKYKFIDELNNCNNDIINIEIEYVDYKLYMINCKLIELNNNDDILLHFIFEKCELQETIESFV